MTPFGVRRAHDTADRGLRPSLGRFSPERGHVVIWVGLAAAVGAMSENASRQAVSEQWRDDVLQRWMRVRWQQLGTMSLGMAGVAVEGGGED